MKKILIGVLALGLGVGGVAGAVKLSPVKDGLVGRDKDYVYGAFTPSPKSIGEGIIYIGQYAGSIVSCDVYSVMGVTQSTLTIKKDKFTSLPSTATKSYFNQSKVSAWAFGAYVGCSDIDPVYGETETKTLTIPRNSTYTLTYPVEGYVAKFKIDSASQVSVEFVKAK